MKSSSQNLAEVPRAFLNVVGLVAVFLMGARLYGAYRWNLETQRLRARLDAARAPVRPQTVHFHELEDLPVPVRRYFRTALRDRQPMVASVRVRHTGTFNMGQTKGRWRFLTSDQMVVTRRSGFDWDGRVAIERRPQHVVRVIVGSIAERTEPQQRPSYLRATMVSVGMFVPGVKDPLPFLK